MKYFVAIEEDLLMEIWLLNPNLVVPFSRASDSKAKHTSKAKASLNHKQKAKN